MNADPLPWAPQWLRILVALAVLLVGLVVGVAALRAVVVVVGFAAWSAWEGAQRLTHRLSEAFIHATFGVAAVIAATFLMSARAFGWLAVKRQDVMS